MLDEVDKLGADFRGDPSSALLEVLDPEQNREFRDHYLDVPFDLSQVIFITTANDLDTIPGPLRDRMEIIELSGYTEQEKISIAQGYLIPRQIKENGLRAGEVTFTDAALAAADPRLHARGGRAQPGARDRQRLPQAGDARSPEGTTDAPVHDRCAECLDVPAASRKFLCARWPSAPQMPGVATGLAWTPVGGDIMFIEATRMPGSKGFQLTGQLGDVMQESAQAALSLCARRAPIDWI